MNRRLLVAGLTAAALLSLSASAQAQAPATLLINELDYDQPGTDAREYVEIRNNGTAAVDLDPYTLRLVDGDAGGSAVYTSVDLPAVSLASGAYYVVCGNQTTVTECDLDGGANTDFIQNGAPDAVGLVLGVDTIVDAVSYEGTVPGYTEGGGAPADSGSAQLQSISRSPAGTDTNDNATDFTLVCSTPGAANATTDQTCPVTRIHDIQGNGSSSPIAGQTVKIEGVVTGVDDEIGSDFERTFPADAGIFVQQKDADVDADPNTSEGIYVGFVRDRGSYPPGTVVRLTGVVREHFGETRIEETDGEEPVKLGEAAVPLPVLIEPGFAQ